MASCTCGHTEGRHLNNQCLDCPITKCRKFKASNSATKAKASRDARDELVLPDARVPGPNLSPVKEVSPLPIEVVHADILSAADGAPTTPLVKPQVIPTDGPDGAPVILSKPTKWKPERLDFYVRGDITMNLGHLGEYLAISAIGEIFWHGHRLGRNAELRRRVISWLGNTNPDDQPPIAAVEGGLNLNSSHGCLPFRPGCKRGAPGKIIFVGADGQPVMSIAADGFHIGDELVTPDMIIGALMGFFDDAEPTGNGVAAQHAPS